MASRPTIIIIPGAWQQPPIWEEFCTALKGARYPTQLVALPSVGGEALPLAGLTEDVAAVRSYIGTSVAQGEEIILVCHCSGAIVGSNAVIGFDRPSRAGFGLAGGVIQMVFLAGFIALPGNSLLDVLGGEPLPWMHIQGDRVTGLAEMFPGIAFNDLSKQDQDRWAGQMTHTSITHFSGKTNYAPWDHGINCAYIFCLEDKVLPYDIQQNMADLLGSKSGRSVVKSSHYPFLSASSELLEALESVTRAVGKD